MNNILYLAIKAKNNNLMVEISMSCQPPLKKMNCVFMRVSEDRLASGINK
jgi:hypothetical protein